MYLAYSLLLTFGILLLLPRFLYQALIHGKYVHGFSERLGSIPVVSNSVRPVIWLHCVSVGETQAARALVNELRVSFPESTLVISTTTLTGQRLAQDVFKGQASRVFYFPFDWRWSVRRALSRIGPALVLIMETELWPNFLKECQHRNIRVAIVNGRISQRSFQRYNLVRVLLKRVLSSVDLALMQSESDAQRMRDLGMTASRIVVTGNLKFDSSEMLGSTEITDDLQSRFNLSDDARVVVAASTHSPEEKVLLDSLQIIRTNFPVRLILAPRHPERFQEVAKLIEAYGFSWARRTNSPSMSDTAAEVILLDTIGELPATYSLADVVFVGGSIVDRGGHNLLEPAALGACIVTGAHTHNFKAIAELLKKEDAVAQLPHLEERDAATALSSVLSQLLQDPAARSAMGQRARQTVAANRGATARTIALISSLLQSDGVDRLTETAAGGASASA